MSKYLEILNGHTDFLVTIIVLLLLIVTYCYRNNILKTKGHSNMPKIVKCYSKRTSERTIPTEQLRFKTYGIMGRIRSCRFLRIFTYTDDGLF